MRTCLLLLVPMVALCAEPDEKLVELLKKSELALKMEKLDASLEFAEEAIKLDAKSPVAHFRKGDALLRLRKYDDSIRAFDTVLTLDPKGALAHDRKGAALFCAGRIDASIAEFDLYLKEVPRAMAAHWQRGISLYYAGRFQDGADQFEAGKVAFGNDVENAFWHWLCLARKATPDKARESLLKVGPDARVPMAEIYQLVLKKTTPEAVLEAAKKDGTRGEGIDERLFYANLYIGLWYEAEGDAAKCKEHLKAAVEKKIGHYMWDVANVHLAKLK